MTIADAERKPAISFHSDYGLVDYPRPFPTSRTGARTGRSASACQLPILDGGRIKANEAIARAGVDERQGPPAAGPGAADLDDASARARSTPRAPSGKPAPARSSRPARLRDRRAALPRGPVDAARAVGRAAAAGPVAGDPRRGGPQSAGDAHPLRAAARAAARDRRQRRAARRCVQAADSNGTASAGTPQAPAAGATAPPALPALREDGTVTRSASFITGSIVVAGALALAACGRRRQPGRGRQGAGRDRHRPRERRDGADRRSPSARSSRASCARSARPRSAPNSAARCCRCARRGPGRHAGRAAGAHRGRSRDDASLGAVDGALGRESRCRWPNAKLARTERLVKGGALAERELESARNAACSPARSATTRSRGSPRRARRSTTGPCARRSPASVARRHVNRGDVVSPGTELYTIIDPSSMRLEASVPSEQLGAITIGATVNFQVRGYPDQTFAGRIERISPMADPVDAPGADLRDHPQHAGPPGGGPVRRRARRAGSRSGRWSCR